MNISQINSTSFSGVKLLNPSFENSRLVNDILQFQGVHVFGHRTFYVNNNFEAKRKLVNHIRRNNNFGNNECGVIFLPWSKESWIIGNHLGEQKIKKLLDSFSIPNKINMGI